MYRIVGDVIKFIENMIQKQEEKFNWGENPESYLPGRCVITITICNCDDPIQSHTKEMNRRIQTS